GSYSASAKTVDPPYTLPSHMSLVTGLKPENHGTYINTWIPQIGYTKHETIFTVANKHGINTSMFVGKDKLNFIAVPDSIDKLEVIEYSPDSVETITESFIKYIDDNIGIILVHFPEPDIPGHKKGWMSPTYLDAVKRVDTEIGKIIGTLKSKDLYDNTLIIITSDHGGKGKNHKGDDPLVTTIPWLAVGKGIKENYIIKDNVYIYDTAPTVLKALELPIPKDIDGSVVEEIFMN
ncbi:MAG: alkaline phosphatase family protein, partial [Thermodesulfobacteriota bacterium]